MGRGSSGGDGGKREKGRVRERGSKGERDRERERRTCMLTGSDTLTMKRNFNEVVPFFLFVVLRNGLAGPWPSRDKRAQPASLP